VNTLIYMLAAILCGVFAMRAWSGDRSDPVRRAFMTLGALMSASYAGFTFYLIPGLTSFRYLYAVAGAFLPVTALWFFDRLFGKPGSRASRMVRQMWLITLGATATFLVIDPMFFGDVPRASIPEVLLALGVFAGFGVVLATLVRRHGTTRNRVEQSRIRYMLSLLGAAVFLTALEMLSRSLGPETDPATLTLINRSFVLQGALPPFGAVTGTLFVYCLYYVVQLYRLLDLHEIFARLFTLAVAAMVLVMVDGIMVIWVGSLSAYPIHGTFQIFLASVLFLSFYDPLRARIEAISGEWFNRQGRRLELTLSEVDRSMSKVISMNGLDNELLGKLHASGRIPVTSLYLRDQARGGFRLSRQRGATDRPVMQVIAHSPFADGFASGQKAYVRTDLERVVQREQGGHEEASARLRTMDAMEADLTLPIRSGGLVLGWLNVKDERWSDGFSHDEIRRLVSTVNRAGVILENLHSFEQIKEQHRLAALGTMSAGLAHEIRNPLAGLKGAAQYLQGDASPDEIPDFLDIIVEEGNRLNEVVTQFLDYARPYNIRPATISPTKLVHRAVELVRAEGLPPTVQIEEHFADTPDVEVDPDKIHQVVLNLLQNALHAVGENGLVEVKIQEGTLENLPKRGAPALIISVKDNGPGIASEDQDNLFIPFFTTKEHGTGLGLAICRRLLEAHKGEISVRSRSGKGSTFTVRLPWSQTDTHRLPQDG